MHWDDILREVARRKRNGQKANILSDTENEVAYIAAKQKRLAARTLKAYSLGAKYNRIKFTRREAECMVLLMKGKTIHNVATLLSISPRTVEYYLKNMRAKLGCSTKFELIDLVHASDFMKNVDFL